MGNSVRRLLLNRMPRREKLFSGKFHFKIFVFREKSGCHKKKMYFPYFVMVIFLCLVNFGIYKIIVFSPLKRRTIYQQHGTLLKLQPFREQKWVMMVNLSRGSSPPEWFREDEHVGVLAFGPGASSSFARCISSHNTIQGAFMQALKCFPYVEYVAHFDEKAESLGEWRLSSMEAGYVLSRREVMELGMCSETNCLTRPAKPPDLCVVVSYTDTESKALVHNNTAALYGSLRPRVQSYRSGGPWPWGTLPEAKTNQHGTPMIGSLLQLVNEACPLDAPLVAYANSDILFDRGLLDTLDALLAWNQSEMLAVGRRRNHDLEGPLRTTEDVARSKGELFIDIAQDYFILTRGMVTKLEESELPPFVIGRRGYDNALVDWAFHRSSLIDLTQTVNAVHQTTSDGNYAGHSTLNADKEYNVELPGVVYDHGSTTHALFETVHEEGSIAVVRRSDQAVVARSYAPVRGVCAQVGGDETLLQGCEKQQDAAASGGPLLDYLFIHKPPCGFSEALAKTWWPRIREGGVLAGTLASGCSEFGSVEQVVLDFAPDAEIRSDETWRVRKPTVVRIAVGASAMPAMSFASEVVLEHEGAVSKPDAEGRTAEMRLTSRGGRVVGMNELKSPLLVTFGNHAYKEMLASFLCNTRLFPPMHAHMLVMVTDQATVDYLTALDTDVTIGLWPHDVQSGHDYDTPEYVKLMLLRGRLLLQLLGPARVVVWIEADAHYTGNLLEHVSTGSTDLTLYWDGVCYGGGFIRFAATEGARAFYADIMARLEAGIARGDFKNDQGLLNDALTTTTATYTEFDRCMFRSGMIYHPKHGPEYQARCKGTRAVVQQHNWVLGNEKKIALAQEKGAWYLEPSGVCTPRSLRAVVMTMDRPASLERLLASLRNAVYPSGARIDVQVSVDRPAADRQHDPSTLALLGAFEWPHGVFEVKLWPKPVGIYGQWVDSWPCELYAPDLYEAVVLLEDDLEVSPVYHEWFVGAHKKGYGAVTGMRAQLVAQTGARLSMEQLVPQGVQAFAYRLIATWFALLAF